MNQEEWDDFCKRTLGKIFVVLNTGKKLNEKSCGLVLQLEKEDEEGFEIGDFVAELESTWIKGYEGKPFLINVVQVLPDRGLIEGNAYEFSHGKQTARGWLIDPSPNRLAKVYLSRILRRHYDEGEAKQRFVFNHAG